MNKNSDITTSYKKTRISDVPKANHILSDYFIHSIVWIRNHRAINGYGS